MAMKRITMCAGSALIASVALYACGGGSGSGASDAGTHDAASSAGAGGTGSSGTGSSGTGSSGTGSSGTGSSGTGSSGTGSSGTGSSGTGSSGAGGTGGSGTCPAASKEVVPAQTNAISNLCVVGDKLVFLSSDTSDGTPSKIDVIHSDGTQRSTLHTSTGGRRVRSVMAAGSDVFFLEANEDTVPVYELWRVPVAGGAAARVGTASFPNGSIFGLDATHVFVVVTSDQPVGALFERVTISSGAIEHLGSTTGTPAYSSVPAHVSISGTDIFFIAGGTGASAGLDKAVLSFKTTDTNAAPKMLWTVPTNDPCMLPLGGLLATPTTLACGFSEIDTHKRDGTSPHTLVANDFMQGHVLVATDAENLYVIQRVGPTEHAGLMQRIPSAGGSLTKLVCDLGPVSNKLVDGTFRIQTDYEVAMGASSVFWVEEPSDATSGAVSYLLRSAPK